MAIFKAVTKRDGTALGKGKMKRLENYLKYETDERGRLQLDDHGHPVPRDAIVTALNGDADDFTFSCQEIFAQWNVNRNPDSVQYKHYVQGFSPEDNEKMDRETCHRLGVELAQTVWKDFPVLVVSHFDQETDGAYHWHNHFIVGNCNVTNGKKLCTSSAAMWAQKRFVAVQAEAHGLTRRGLVLDDGRILEAGDRETTYEHSLARKLAAKGRALSYEQLRGQETLTQKEELRIVIREAKQNTSTFEDFARYLNERYGVEVKKTRNGVSYLHPDRKNVETLYGNGWIRDKSLGANYGERRPSQKRLRKHNALVQGAELRLMIRDAVRRTDSFEGFCSYLQTRYGVEVKLTRGAISYLHPDRKNVETLYGNGWIRGRSLGTAYEKEAIDHGIGRQAQRRIAGAEAAQGGGRAARDAERYAAGADLDAFGRDSERFKRLEELYRDIFADVKTDGQEIGGRAEAARRGAGTVGTAERERRTRTGRTDRADRTAAEGLGEGDRGGRGQQV